MIDSHCHLDFSQFDRDRDFVLSRTKSRLKFVINPTVNSALAENTLKLLGKEEFIYFLLGFHPHYAKDFQEDVFQKYEACLSGHDRIMGIGEIGLDFYRNLSEKDVQINVFRRFLEYAIKKKMPVVIHLREAEDKMKEILDSYEFGAPVILHCFSSSEKFSDYAIQQGFYISFAGNISYPSNDSLRQIVKKVPLNKLLLETDAPYLAPSNKRGRRNEPLFVFDTLNYVASLLDKESGELEKVIEENCVQAFNIKIEERTDT